MSEIFIKAVQLLLCLSILVIIHELGHFTFAKLFKTRVEKFYLFFDPWFSLFKKKKGDTEYGIGWLPLGGYVKIAGMIDESMDKEQMDRPMESWEFRAKPAWQRLLIMIGGVLFNFILAMIIYSTILYTNGETYLSNSSMKDGVYVSPLADSLGFNNGDKIIGIDGNKIDDYNKFITSLVLDNPDKVTVTRDGQEINIALGEKNCDLIWESGFNTFLRPRTRSLRVDSVLENSIASNSGILKGDKFIALDNLPIIYTDQFLSIIKSHPKGILQLSILRNGEIIEIPVNIPDSFKIGVIFSSRLDSSYYVNLNYGLLSSIPGGIVKGSNQIVDYAKQLRLLIKRGKAKDVGGFIGIAKLFPSYWDWIEFWTITAFLSIILGVMNILPIPALDGGHVLFVIYEIITRRKPSEKFMEYAVLGGMVLLLALLLFANGNDIYKLFQK